jgi:hypothetical protein
VPRPMSKAEHSTIYAAKVSWYHIIIYPPIHSISLVPNNISIDLFLLLTLSAPHTSKVSSSILRTTSNAANAALHAISGTLSVSTKRSLALDGLARLIFATAFGAVDAFLGDCVTEGLSEAAFADLARYEAVDAVLEVVDLFDAGDFRLVEVFCGRC